MAQPKGYAAFILFPHLKTIALMSHPCSTVPHAPCTTLMTIAQIGRMVFLLAGEGLGKHSGLLIYFSQCGDKV
jgi:hypothetical protein